LGNRTPPALKAFLLAVAVVDDLGAIVIVAFFYTEQVALGALLAAALVFGVLVAFNRLGVRSVGLYVLVGVFLWVALYQAGISPTLAGVLVAACVPLSQQHGHSPLHEAEDDFRPWVLYGIMPVFAFANAGLVFDGLAAYVTHPVTLGAGLGLICGKPVGICVMTWLGVKLFKSPMPGTALQVFGVSCLAGIGFTMSLFIGALAFKDPALGVPMKLGVYAGSLISAILGLLILLRALPPALTPEEAAQNDETHPFMAPDPDNLPMTERA
jgi:NhaA family Na+:H+ antiporter